MRLTWPVVIVALAVAHGSPVGANDSTGVPAFERIAVPGIVHGSIIAVAQDAEGFLWIGTRDGLSRWDGYEVVSFRNAPDDPTSLSNHFVTYLLVDSRERLWVGTERGLDRYDPTSHAFIRYPLPATSGSVPGGPAPAVTVWSMLEDEGGTIWAGTSDGVFRLAPGQDDFEAVGGGSRALPEATPSAMAIRADPGGSLWVMASAYPRDASASALYRLRADEAPGDAVRFEEFQLQQLDLAPYSFLIDSHGRFWTGGAVPERPNPSTRRLEPVTVTDVSPETARAFLEDSLGRVWIGTIEGLFVALPGSDVTIPVPLPDESNWLANYVNALFEDSAGTIWVGTNAGLLRADPALKPFHHIRESDAKHPERGLSLGAAASIAVGPDEDLWVGTWGAGVDRIDAETGLVRRYPASADATSPLPEATAAFVLADSSGRMWVAANEHLCGYVAASDSFRCHRVPEGDGTLRWIWNVFESPSGRLFAGTNYARLFEFLPDRGEFVPFPADPATRAAMDSGALALAAEDDRTLWVGGYAGALTRLDLESNTAVHMTLSDGQGRPGSAVHDLLVDTRGHVWVGTGGGLFVLPSDGAPPVHYGQADGLPGSYVYGLLEDERGRLWLSTNRGIARIDSPGPDAVVSRTYDLEDGIGSMEFNRRARVRAQDGRLYFGGMSGVTWFDPTGITDNLRPPPVVLTSIQIADGQGRERSLHGVRDVVVEPDDHAVSFQFAALSYTAPRKNRYRYRLDGFDEAWVEAGDRRFATYTNVPPGAYVFRVQGSNNDGVWNELGVAVPVEVMPAMWETWWFRLMAAVALAAALGLAYRLRVNHLLAIERVRSRIAGDLHDDLSSDLSGIALTMDLLERRSALDEADRRRVAHVRATALAMVDGVRDIVWYVNPEHDSLEALVRRMRTVSSTLLPDRTVELSVDISDTAVPIEMSFRRHVFLAFKELLHNVVRHSRASRVWITLGRVGDTLALHVRDDGVGFDPTEAPAGDGLASLERRANQLGARLSIQSASGTGTRVSFEVPLRGGSAGRSVRRRTA